jgi:hypothetical protein
MNLINKIRRKGILGSISHAVEMGRGKWSAYQWRNAPKYQDPTEDELTKIEKALQDLGVSVEDYHVDIETFSKFQKESFFPPEYHGGRSGTVWNEKLLEHFITAELMDLWSYTKGDIYVDIAAASSPWVNSLRTRLGLNAFAIDLSVPERYINLSYYRIEDATATTFNNGSVKGASLHCAFEMFMGDDDINFIVEANRFLAPGGKVVILPLYLHTHYCAYSTPEYWGKGYSDSEAMEYVRSDCMGIPSSRKYDAISLKRRILDPIKKNDLRYRLLALRNKETLGRNIYCHFILEITR